LVALAVGIHPEAHLVERLVRLVGALAEQVARMLAVVAVLLMLLALAGMAGMAGFHLAVAVAVDRHAQELCVVLAVMAERDIVRSTHGKDIRSH
jgi:hypothetical protein